MEPDKPQPVRVQITFELDPNTRCSFSDHQNVLSTENEVILTFFQSIHPALSEPTKLEAIGTVPAVSVARIILTPKVFERFVGVLSEHLARRTGIVPEQPTPK